ncbi:hypothetical protein B0H14DRAFT_2591345 [Mycena olivaceomarginata]|nr:hypothetical protein B0H14DRAFT_2591345 [Mycena olivaceomarginata]
MAKCHHYDGSHVILPELLFIIPKCSSLTPEFHRLGSPAMLAFGSNHTVTGCQMRKDNALPPVFFDFSAFSRAPGDEDGMQIDLLNYPGAGTSLHVRVQRLGLELVSKNVREVKGCGGPTGIHSPNTSRERLTETSTILSLDTPSPADDTADDIGRCFSTDTDSVEGVLDLVDELTEVLRLSMEPHICLSHPLQRRWLMAQLNTSEWFTHTRLFREYLWLSNVFISGSCVEAASDVDGLKDYADFLLQLDHRVPPEFSTRVWQFECSSLNLSGLAGFFKEKSKRVEPLQTRIIIFYRDLPRVETP